MRLLLAEDEKDLSDARVTVLKHNNYSVDAVYNGQDALEYLETDNYDAAILDIMMPKMDGITVLKTIRAITRRQAQTTDSLLQLGNIRLDCSTYLLSTEKGTLRLANKEYQMLEMLLTNPGQVISVEQFMDRIWGYDSDAELNVVWFYISYLRKKLASLDAQVQIHSSRGLGYSIMVSEERQK